MTTNLERLCASLTEEYAIGKKIRQKIGAIADVVEGAGRSQLNVAETVRAEALQEQLRDSESRLDEVVAALGEEPERLDRRRKADEVHAMFRGNGSSWQVTSEPRTYDRRSAQDGVSIFADLVNAGSGDLSAQERLQRHSHEARVDGREARAASTSSFAGLVPPAYLVDDAALVPRAARPFGNALRSLQLPEQGMSLVVPRGTTGASVTSQATENTTVSSTDQVWANLTVPVVTIAGMQDVSRQSIERGSPGLDSLIFGDLAAAYAAELDRQCLNGSGASGQILGVLQTSSINSATAFGAAPTAGLVYTKIGGQSTAVQGSRFLAPDLIVMHPRRWAWLFSQTDSTGRPLVVPTDSSGAMNAQGALRRAYDYGNIVGSLQGLPVVTDANVPTNVGTNSEDVILVMRSADSLLWEQDPASGLPQELRFEQTLGGQLTIRLVAYGYVAFTAGRYPGAVGKIGGLDTTAGQGLVAPSF